MPAHVKFQFTPAGETEPIWGEAEVPNDVPLEAFLSEAEKSYGRIHQVEVGRSWGETAVEAGKDVGRGFLKAARGVAQGAVLAKNLLSGQGPDDALELVQESQNAVPNFPEKAFPTPSMDSRARQIFRGALEGLGGSPGSPRTLLAGFAGGGGAEMGSEFGGPVGAFTGGLLGTGLAMIPGLRHTNTAELAQGAMGDLSPQDLAYAKRFSQMAQEMGMPLLPNQATPKPSRLDDIADFLAQTHNAPKTQTILRNQPGQVAVRSQVELSGLPGEVLPTQQAEDEISRAATALINQTKKERTRLFQQTLESGQDAERSAAGRIMQRALAAARGERFANKTTELWNKEDEISAVKQLASIFAARTKDGVPVGSQGVNPRGFLLDAPAVGNKQGDAVIGNEANRGLAAGQGKIVLPQSNRNPEGVVAAPQFEPKVEVPARRPTLNNSEQLLRDAQRKLSQAGNVEPDRLIAFDEGLQRYAQEHSNQPAVVRLVNDLRASLRESREGVDTWVTDPSKLKGGFDAAMKGEGASTLGTATPQRISNFHHSQLDQLFKQTVATEGTPLRQALDAFSEFSKTRVDPLRAGPIGRVAGKLGLAPDAESATGAKLAQIYSAKRDVNGYKEIQTLQQELAGVEGGNEAFVNAAKTHLSNVVSEALKQSSNRIADNAAKNLYTALYSTPAQKRALETTLETMAAAAGKDPDAVKTGFQKFVQIAGAMAERPNRVTSFPAAEANRIAGQSATGTLVKSVASPFYRAGQGMINRVSEKTLKEMDAIFAAPDALDQLERLAKMPLMSRRAQLIIGGMLGTTVSQAGVDPVTE